ncbi:hypothetical protein J7I98_23650 [Streptomyces sp. ISL-98]|uniref:hypothetical protein n=1 Tax=Streptomyces sp. ISL-98 TaxID=2819192 RepID=UPI001BED1513|nr:hypothetical protein [Streptomyces sp. ISL-98]MBT2508826.1 hypothetical protein [Streptomyces sp. ISL-98]
MSEQPDETPGALARIMNMEGCGQVKRILNQAIYGNADGPDRERTPVSDELARAVDEVLDGPENSEEKNT